MHHSRTNGKHDLKVQETLTELIDNNKIILESRIKNDAIYHFI
jgi:cytidylate kinase